MDCSTFQTSSLLNIHGVGTDNLRYCSTCQPTYYDSLGGNWEGGCQQGGCHTTYHADSIKAHKQWDDPYDPANDCNLCHNPGVGDVVQTNCLHCHATYGPTDTTPPTTSTNALATYTGPAKINFPIRDNGGKVGIGRTFYTLDDGEEAAAMNLFITEPGMHVLEFWSKDQSGKVDTPHKTTTFNIAADIEPPVTTSDAKSTYSQGAKITLNATANSTHGVKETYYSLNGGTTKIGTVVNIPATSGTITYICSSGPWTGPAISNLRTAPPSPLPAGREPSA